ncbi:MAG: 23S rRNA pseudouridylate synthase, partial [Gammaproteobacteria bacterium]|nr:23S rRNA pseudouridylate synthase [Gammaproteobacteria bacterium]NNM12687.1 23S rRNA pseudouridylate synthase [Gammaproteobacteria bacterium]
MTTKKTLKSDKELPKQRKIVLFNKPFQVLSQFTDESPKKRITLANYIPVKNVYAAGRLDYDSEGLLVLTDDGQLQARISSPKYKMPKTYFVQIEGQVTEKAIEELRKGVKLKDGRTQAAAVS